MNENFSFYTVRYGTGYENTELATIAIELNGKSTYASTADKLEKIFDEIIRNVFLNDKSVWKSQTMWILIKSNLFVASF